MSLLSLHSILLQSEVNGPGRRMVIWTQGCSHGCPGCFNPETWKFEDRWLESVENIYQRILLEKPDGITFTGGDPLEQSDSLLALLKLIHSGSSPETLGKDFLPKGIICFTGFLLEDLVGSGLECVDYIDLLIDGLYIKELRYTSGLAGSSNQRFHFSKHSGRGESRLRPDEILIDQSIEVHVDDIDSDIVHVTGFPIIDRKFLKDLGLSIESSSDI